MAASASAPSLELTDSPWSPIALPSSPFLGKISEDTAAHMAGEMSVVHNVLIRSLNALWHNAALVSAKDTPAFVGYALLVLSAIHSHHETEEKIMFPAFSGTGIAMEENIEQHKAFHDGMEAFERYLEQVKNKELLYDAVKTRELLKVFADPLVHHLHDEISTIQPEIMERADKKVLDQFVKDLEAHLKEEGGLTTSIPFVLTAHKTQDAPLWPPLPPVLKWLTKNVFSRVNASYWKFAPFTQSGEPQIYKP
ncbi:hypothetical protein MD484_g611, partial [Candolleomyces efflorescens]